MKLKVLAAAIYLLGFAVNSYAAEVEFHIAAGTVGHPWNTAATSIKAKTGDTIHFVNDDTVVHRLHTFGAPCEHGPEFMPGTSWDCVTTAAYSSTTDGPLYDHNFGEEAAVFFEVSDK